ncbi:MAG: hypothetical protein QOE90_2894 [Thermoplasmata archaeon]|nr:hypothetical protein [Thermoplasmata archaeon]
MRLPLLLLALAGLLLGGCLGQGKAPAPVLNTSSVNATAAVDTGSPTTISNVSTGAAPHKHDYWQGKERVTVLREDLTLAPTDGASFIPFFLDQKPAIGAAVLALPDGQTVFEGTGRLEFTATWSDPTITGLTLRYKSTGNPDYGAPAPLSSGKPLVVDVTPAMTDEPHAKSSRWGFILEADGPGGAGLADGKVGVKADIIKMRDIETFPAHPDLFAGADSIKLLDKDMTIKSDSSADTVQGFFTHTLTPPGFAPDKPVPPEAKTILVRLDVKSATSNMPLEDTSQVSMQYRTAESAFNYDDANQTKHDGKTYVFKIESDPVKGDGYYAKTSAWRLDPVITDNVQGQEVNCVFGDCFAWSMDAHVTMIAYKDDVAPDAILAR